MDNKIQMITRDEVECEYELHSALKVGLLKNGTVVIVANVAAIPHPVGIVIATSADELKEFIKPLLHFHVDHLTKKEQAAESVMDELMKKMH